MMLDTRYSIETPEGISLQLTVAGPAVRVLAYLIDLLIRGTIQLGLVLVLSLLGVAGWGLLTIAMFILGWFYSVMFEVFWQGQTPGKRVMGLTVVNDNATAVGWSSSIIRNLFRVVDIMPLFYSVGLISMSINPHFKRVGDLAAGTVVIYSRERKPVNSSVAKNSRPAPVKLDIEERRSLLSFSDRVDEISQARRYELANILQPVFKVENEEGVRALLETANGIRGGH